MSKSGDIFVDNDNNDRTDYFIPCACARGNDLRVLVEETLALERPAVAAGPVMAPTSVFPSPPGQLLPGSHHLLTDSALLPTYDAYFSGEGHDVMLSGESSYVWLGETQLMCSLRTSSGMI